MTFNGLGARVTRLLRPPSLLGEPLKLEVIFHFRADGNCLTSITKAHLTEADAHSIIRNGLVAWMMVANSWGIRIPALENAMMGKPQ